ncbi:MAG: AMP-binding protein [Alphaproteobacteria bacterium]|nr:AMP-binding protein [Alphaproteobacteria bacterium]
MSTSQIPTQRAGNARGMTIADGIFSAARRTPDRLAIRESGRGLSYAQLAARIRRVANLVHEGLGLRHGDRAAVLLPNRLEYIEIVAGASLAGVASATIGPAASTAEIAFICEDSDARVLFVDPALEEKARAAVPGSVRHVIVLDRRYEDALARSSDAMCRVRTDERDIFSIPYTSGATGRPKGVMLSHRGRILSAYAIGADHGCYGPDDRAITLTPLFHGAGFLMTLTPLFFGGFVELLPRFDLERMLTTIQEIRATNTYMVPTHFSALFAMGEAARRYDVSSLKAVVSGTAPLAQAMKERIIEFFGEGRLYERYGCTETSIVTALRPADQLRKTQCVGLPLPATQIRVLGDDGAEVPRGEVGELACSSPYMFSGYLNLPEATEKAMRGDWFVTGDLARMDEEGFLYLVDRKNDMIITGGENVYPREVEEILLAHPGVQECAVVGLPHAYWGEAVTAFVVRRPGADVTAEALAASCRAAMSPYKVPKEFRFEAALPRNSMGKVLRRALRDAAPKP